MQDNTKFDRITLNMVAVPDTVLYDPHLNTV